MAVLLFTSICYAMKNEGKIDNVNENIHKINKKERRVMNEIKTRTALLESFIKSTPS